MDELDKILQLLKKGDRRGLELLFHHFYKPLVFYAMNFLVQQEEAEDAVQEVFIKFWEGKRFLIPKCFLEALPACCPK